MAASKLPKQPLVEAVFELHWKLSETNGLRTDKYYALALDLIQNRLSHQFPVHEKLKTATLPAELVPHVAQHRFRASEDGWPLVQIGPGVLTINDTEAYDWETFRGYCLSVVSTFFELYPADAPPVIEQIELTYIDADFLDGVAPTDFLRRFMQVSVDVPPALFDGGLVEPNPSGVNLQLVFTSKDPKGGIRLAFRDGEKNDKPALVWETQVMAAGEHLPELPAALEKWLEAAHVITHSWFEHLTAGELHRRYE